MRNKTKLYTFNYFFDPREHFITLSIFPLFYKNRDRLSSVNALPYSDFTTTIKTKGNILFINTHLNSILLCFHLPSR